MNVTTRFAPSPTGYLHIGGARTALFCWLYARRQGGQYILRIEDTDRERSTQASIDIIFEAMEWLGLDPDEGPFYQTQRFERYASVLAEMEAKGLVYRCYCSKERLTALREEQMAQKQKPRYDGLCRDQAVRDTDEPYVLRFCNPTSGTVVVNDLIRGPVEFKNSELDDLIIARSDGTPTYNFTVVVDDWDMKVTHVIRGDDHLNNTPRQINILAALGAAIPQYAHVPMILGSDGKRLSKRHGAVNILQYRDEGYLPEALLNYLVRLGWSHGDQEIFSLEDMISQFDIADVNKAAASFNEEKLLWLNQYYIKTKAVGDLAQVLDWHFRQLGINSNQGPALEQIVMLQRERVKTLKQMAEQSRFFYEEFSSIDEKIVQKHLKPAIIPALAKVKTRLQELTEWEKSAIHQVIIETAEACELKLGKLAQPLRVAVTGGTVSPSIDITLQLLGKQRVLERLQRVIAN